MRYANPSPYGDSGYVSPLGQALADTMNGVTQVMTSGPNAYDRADAQAGIDYKNALTKKTGVETTGLTAQQAAPKNLADAMRAALAQIAAGKKPAEAFQSVIPDIVQGGYTVDPKADIGQMMRGLGYALPDMNTDYGAQLSLGAGDPYKDTIPGTREGFVADQTKQDSVNTTDLTKDANDNARALAQTNLEQTGLNNRMTVNTPAGTTTSLPVGSPIGKTTIQGIPTLDTSRAAEFNNQAGAGAYTTDEPMVPGSPAAVLAGETGVPSNTQKSGKNWAAPDGGHGVTFDGLTDSSTGKPLPAGWQFSSEVGQQGTKLKVIPAGAVQGMLDNKRSVDNIDKTFLAIKDAPNGIGLQGYLASLGTMGQSGLNAIDPNGVNLRANIANIGSLQIHDRSGAAVTVSETPRLIPFIPLITDSTDVAKTKLKRLRAEILSMLQDQDTSYSEDGGYIENPAIKDYLGNQIDPSGGVVDISKAPDPDKAYDLLQPGTHYTGPDGKEYIKPGATQ